MDRIVDVLIVDDRIDGLITLEAVLTQPDIRLVKAQSGKEALELLDLYEFSVILLDVQMPDMDGFETSHLIRQNEKYKLTPIIFVTAINKDDRYVYKGYEAGAVDYLFKPFDPAILRSKVNVFIDLYRKSRQLQEQAELIRETERRERYLRLTELEVESLRRYRSLADAIPHMVWRARGDGTLDYFNKGWSDYTGLSTEQSIGSGWQSAIHPRDINKFLKTWMASMAVASSFETEVRISNHNGEERWFWVKAVCETNLAGHVTAWLGTCTDIHDRKMTEMRLIKAEKEANAASESKTSFLANMSHEIRTPMNAILGFTELMLDPMQSTDERQMCIATVQRNASQLLKILDEILDISKVESGHMQIEKVEVNVSSLADDLKSLLSLQAADKGLEFNVGLLTPVPQFFYSDPTRLRQILLNLTGNAIKFTKEGHVRVTAEWEVVDATHGHLIFKISDTGVGIQATNVDHLFQPFVQEDSSITRNFGGTGLGLALSRQLARAMGGDVTLESSTPGQGSVFCLSLEIETPESTPFVGNLELLFSQRTKKIPKIGDRRLQDMNVLLVEDVVDNQALMVHFLNFAGAHVDVANNGSEGVEKALSGNYDAVLMDIQMPVLDGYQATQQLREQGYETPIIALTAHAMAEERERSLQAGCNDHLSKPVEFNNLVDHLMQMMPPKKNERDNHAQ
jgi:PAS domain S-box-containing protein